MLKKIVLFGILFFVCFNVFAYDDENIIPKNVMSTEGLILPSLFIWRLLETPVLLAAFQYERQLMENFSVGGRLGYFMIGEEMISISAESIARYYPGKGTFFVNGIIGYAALLHFLEENDTINLANYFKFGVKIGWKIDFGKPGGFVLEPSFGYILAIGRSIRIVDDYNYDWYLFSNETLNMFIRNIVGGPKISLCLGYRF